MVETEAYQVRKQGAFIRQSKQDYMIYYHERKFKAVRPLDKGDTVIEADTEAELEVLIKKHEAELRRFKPLDVIKVDDCHVGRITSRVADDERLIYFSYKEEEEAKPIHTKESLESYSWDPEGKSKARFVEVTEKNKQIIAQIQNKKQVIEAHENEMAALKKQFEKPVTWERLEKAGGKE